jgi:hypothetical protein
MNISKAVTLLPLTKSKNHILLGCRVAIFIRLFFVLTSLVVISYYCFCLVLCFYRGSLSRIVRDEKNEHLNLSRKPLSAYAYGIE